MSDWQIVGKHRMRTDEDLLTFESRDDLSRGEMEAMLLSFDALRGAYGYGLLLVRVVSAGLIAADARRMAVEYNRVWKPRWSMAVCGVRGPVGLITRGTVTLAQSAIRLVSGQVIPLSFFDSEPKAYLWLNEQRMRWRSMRGQQTED